MSSIDREDTIKILKDLQKDHLQFCLIPFRQAIERVQALPSADRPQGEWIPSDTDGFVCSVCKNGYRNQPTLMGRPMFEYCPVCGARMKGADDE